MAWLLHLLDCSSEERSMTLKIRRVAGEREIRICLSGQLRAEHIDQLKSEVERGGPLSEQGYRRSHHGGLRGQDDAAVDL